MNEAAAALARQRWAHRRADKVCPHCGQAFRGDTQQTYCTPAHQNAAAARRFREKRQAGLAPRALPQAANGPQPASPLDARLERDHALVEAQWARAGGDLAEAERWERIAAGIGSRVD